MTRWLLPALLTLAACDSEQEDDPCQSVPALTWENFGQGHLDKHCNGCHGVQLRPEQRNNAPVGIDFDTYDLTLEWADRIVARSIVNGDMPPGGGPSPDENALFEEWLLCEVMANEP